MTAPIVRATFFAHIRATGLLGVAMTQTEVDGLTGILDAWEQQGWPADLRHVAYTMATAWHEARLNMAIREVGLGRGHQYGVPVNGKAYYGRGACQLTWLDNYRKFGRLLNCDLVGNPDLALVPETSAAILIIGSRDGLFRAGKTLARFFNERTDDPVGARDIINGDVAKNGARIAGYHRIFLACLQAALLPAGSAMPVGKVETKPLPPPAPAPVASKLAPPPRPTVSDIAPPAAPRPASPAPPVAAARVMPSVPAPPAPKPGLWATWIAPLFAKKDA